MRKSRRHGRSALQPGASTPGRQLQAEAIVPPDQVVTGADQPHASLQGRGRALAHTRETSWAAVWLVATSYKLISRHAGLRSALTTAHGRACLASSAAVLAGSGRAWLERTPAMAAGLTDHAWTLRDLLHYRVPLPAWVAPKRRGRPPKQLQPPPIRRAA